MYKNLFLFQLCLLLFTKLKKGQIVYYSSRSSSLRAVSSRRPDGHPRRFGRSSMSCEGWLPGARVALVSSGRPTVCFQHRTASWRTTQTVEHHGERRRRLYLLRVERSRLNVSYRAHRGAIPACDHYYSEARYFASETRKSCPFNVQRKWLSAA